MPVNQHEATLMRLYRERTTNRIRKDLRYLNGKGDLGYPESYAAAVKVLRERGELNWIPGYGTRN